jgi:hypothetical protein
LKLADNAEIVYGPKTSTNLVAASIPLYYINIITLYGLLDVNPSLNP